ncbi:MAG: TaqI-like C-terminal specificity domain-containing protein [Pseudothermotoga sp.]
MFPSLYSYLLGYKEPLSRRNKEETGVRYEWYALQRWASDYYPEFDKEKVVWKALSTEPAFCLLPEGYYINDKANMLTTNNTDVDIRYLCGVMNSKVFQFYFSTIGINMGHGYEYKIQYVEKVPIPLVDSANKHIADQIIALVDEIILRKQNSGCASSDDKDTADLERQIDLLVYELYDLNEREIEIVEEQ